MAHNFERPDLPYNYESLSNDNRFQVLTRSLNAPPTDIMLDSEFNYVIDSMRLLDDDIANIEVGGIPGGNDPNNANFVLFTNGALIGWKLISDPNCQVGSINGDKLTPSSITAFQLQDGGIPAEKLAPNSVPTVKIVDLNVTAAKMGDNSVPTRAIVDLNVTAPKMADNSATTRTIPDLNVTTPKLGNLSVTTPKIANLNVTLAKLAQEVIDRLVPIGTIVEFAGTVGMSIGIWLECNGQAVNRVNYATLFNNIGTTWGLGDGVTTFNVPDKRGRTGVGIGSDNSTVARITGATAPSITLGAGFGGETQTLTIAQMPSHNHALSLYVTNQFTLGGGSQGTNQNNIFTQANPTQNTGGGAAHPNVQPSVFCRYYIRGL